MWQCHIESLQEGRVQKYTLVRGDAPLLYASVPKLWRNDAEFRSFFIGLLADAPFSAYRWETPPLTTAIVDRDFEFVLLDSRALERPVDRTAFADHFTNEDSRPKYYGYGPFKQRN